MSSKSDMRKLCKRMRKYERLSDERQARTDRRLGKLEVLVKSLRKDVSRQGRRIDRALDRQFRLTLTMLGIAVSAAGAAFWAAVS